jgi:acyl-CoA thioester hydrolase
MHNETQGWLAATNELVLMHIDLETRRSAPMPDAAVARLEAIRDAQAGLPVPPQVGRAIGLKRRPQS